MFGLVKRRVDEYAREQGATDLRSDRVVSFDVTNRMIDGCCYLFFGNDEQTPRWVAKAARTSAGKAVFQVEYDNLLELEAAGMNSGWPTVPAPLGRWEEGQHLVTLQSALGGTLMKNLPGRRQFSPERIDESVEAVYAWWSRFQRCVGVRTTPLRGKIYESEVLAPIRLFRRRFLLEREEEEFLDRRYENGQALHGLELPLMVRHADFCAANMVLNDRGIGVFDWEFPLQHLLPLFDLFFFFSSVRYPYGGRRGEAGHFESFAEVFWEESYFQTAMRACVRRACEEFEVPREAVADLLVLALVQVANLKFEGLLVSHEMEETPGVDPSPEEKRSRWSRFDEPDKDAPFACIRGGVMENLRLVVRRGFPEF